MCCAIKSLAVPLFMMKISSDGMKAAALGQKWTKFGFSSKLARMQPYSCVKGIEFIKMMMKILAHAIFY